MEDSFPRTEAGGWFWDDSSALHFFFFFKKKNKTSMTWEVNNDLNTSQSISISYPCF